MVLKRLDRLTLDESRATVAQTLDVVYGLVSNMAVVMEGAHSLLLIRIVLNIFLVDGKASTQDIREALGAPD